MITVDQCKHCEWAIEQVKPIEFDITFYELRIDCESMQFEVDQFFGKVELPRFYYFSHGILMGMSSFSNEAEITSFLTELYYRDHKKGPLSSEWNKAGLETESIFD